MSNVLRDTFRLLTFRSTHEELQAFSWQHLAFGLGCAWLAGMGRYWDNPRVGLAQHLGLGSVVYVFVMAAVLWLSFWLMRPADWTYKRVAAFVSLVSPPAILYAIPVERYYSLDIANSINVWFLAIVATWRVALLIFFGRRLGQIGWSAVLTAALLPLTLIVTILTVLNLERVVFNIMGGMSNRSANDAAYSVLWSLTAISFLSFLPLVTLYIICAVQAGKRKRKELWEKTKDE